MMGSNKDLFSSNTINAHMVSNLGSGRTAQSYQVTAGDNKRFKQKGSKSGLIKEQIVAKMRAKRWQLV